MVHEQDQLPAPLRGELQARRRLLREERRGLRVLPGVGGFSRVVEQDGEVEHGRIGQPVKEPAVFREALDAGRVVHQGVEFLQAHQGVLIRRVAVGELVLD